MRPENAEPQPEPSSTPEEAPSPVQAESKPADSTGSKLHLPLPSRYRSRSMRLAAVLTVALLALITYGVYWLVWGRVTVWTDDAYVDARIYSVSSRMPGRVGEVPVNEGDKVKRGQLLVQLTRSQMMIRMEQAEAEVAEASAEVEQLRAGTRQEELAVARAETLLHEVESERRETILNRMESLAPRQSVSLQDLERQRTEVAMARAELRISRRRFDLLLTGAREEEIDSAEAKLGLVTARLKDVRADLADLAVTSPIDGVVARRMVDPGEYVEEGQGLVQVVETGRTWVVANLEEVDIESIREGQPVEIEVDAYSGSLFGSRIWKGKLGPSYSATLSRFSILATTSTSGSFIKVTQRVPVRIDWAENEIPPMYPGMNVVVRIDVSE